jgi:thiol-disulfide isomerase/thioredoxin
MAHNFWQKHFLLSLLLLFGLRGAVRGQTVSGNLSALAGQTLKLEGYKGLDTYAISSSVVDDQGNFTLSYAPSDYGIGFLMSEDNTSFLVILSAENNGLTGESLAATETISFVRGQENRWFAQYASAQAKREQALSAWLYLEKIYLQDSLFIPYPAPAVSIRLEKQRIKTQDTDFIASLPQDSYARWLLPKRKLISSVATIAQYRSEEIPATLSALRALDYLDPKLYKSGLLRDGIDAHFWLIENSGHSLDSMYIEMNTSIDSMMKDLVKDSNKLNTVSSYLFDLLERRSLFTSSEYLALKLLKESRSLLDMDLAFKFESYRAMKKGNIAPDILFAETIYKNGKKLEEPLQLSSIDSPYTLLVFGASWCQACSDEMAKLIPLHSKWKAKGVEVVFISFDTDPQAFQSYASAMPFFASCDFKKWDTQVAKDYYVYASPTFYLLDQKREIILKPISVAQMDTFLEYKLQN